MNSHPQQLPSKNIELIEDLPLTGTDRWYVLLAYTGQKQASWLSLESDVWRQGDTPRTISQERLDEIKAVFDELGLFYRLRMREATDQSNPETSRRCVLEHYQWHDQQARKKKVQQQAMAQQAQMRMQMEQGGNDAPPAGGLERGQRQTNGDGTGQQISKAGRKAPITQANNGT
jgi:hypothetical protein